MRLRIAVLCLSLTGPHARGADATMPLPPDAWKTSETLGDVDLSGLTPVQKKAVLKILREEDCSCQCGMKTAECIMKDTNCSYSRTIAKIAIQGVKDGKSLIEISKLMDASPKAHRPKLLEAPITIAVDGAPVKGPADARITLVEFSDFECPFCSSAVKQVDIVMAAYPKDVKLIYKQFPLSMHPHAELAAEASLAAREQGKFWEMYDVLFKNFRTTLDEQHNGYGEGDRSGYGQIQVGSGVRKISKLWSPRIWPMAKPRVCMERRRSISTASNTTAK